MTSPAAEIIRLPIPGGMQMAVRYDNNGQESVVVLGFRKFQQSTPTVAQALAQLDRWHLFARGSMSNSVVCTGATLRDVSGAEGLAIEVGPPTNPAGAASSPVALGSASALIKWSTANGSRSGKGRTYIPGLPQSVLQANGRNVSTAQITGVATSVATYLSTSATAGVLIPAVLSFKRGIAYDITSGALSPIVGQQSRRMR